MIYLIRKKLSLYNFIAFYTSMIIISKNFQPQKMNNINSITNSDSMIFGYYPIRGKGQMCRLLCQYLHLPYHDLLFTPKTWQEFKATQQLDMTFEELPFLKDGDIIITETYPICMYLVYKANRQDLLGGNLIRQIKLDTLLSNSQPVSYITTSIFNRRDPTPQVRADVIQKLWEKVMLVKFLRMEREATEDSFYFQTVSLIDFYIYETFYYLNIVTPERIHQLPKLNKIFGRFSNLPQIKAYEQSKKCIKSICPVKFLYDLREAYGKNKRRVENRQINVYP